MARTEVEFTPDNPPLTRRLFIPFLNTPPLWDLHWLLCLFPVWWLLGAEQIVWMVGSFWAAAKLIVRQRGRIQVAWPIRLLILFLIIHLISGLFIVEQTRWITFIRNFGTYTVGLAVALVVTNCVHSWSDIKYTLKALFIAVGFSTAVSLASLLGIWRPQFLSLTGQLLPQWILATDYGRQIAYRTVGQPGWFIGLGDYYRLNGFFLFATLHASALVYTLPFLFFIVNWTKSWRRWLWLVLTFLVAVALLFTTARIPIVSLFLGGFYFALFASRWRRPYQGLGAVVAMLLIITVSSTFLLENFTYRPLLQGQLTEAVDTFLYARGGGSFASRMHVYENTIVGAVERPFFGWGTERHLPDSRLPAGSHNEYLAVLYRQGIIGFGVHLLLLWGLWRYTRPIVGAQTAAGDLLRYGRWFFIAFVFNSISIVPITDTTTFLILWLNLSLLLAARKIA